MNNIPYKDPKYIHHRQCNPDEIEPETFRTVPLNHSTYNGKKFKKWKHRNTKAKAIVGKSKKTGKWKTQSILIPIEDTKGSLKPITGNDQIIKTINGKTFTIESKATTRERAKQYVTENKKGRLYRIVEDKFHDFLIYFR